MTADLVSNRNYKILTGAKRVRLGGSKSNYNVLLASQTGLE